MTHLTTSAAKKHGTSALGLALAAAAGATLGLLFAPKDGSAMRRKLAEKVKDMTHRFNKNREAIQEKVKDIFGEVTEEFEKDYIELRSHVLAGIDELEDKAKFTKHKFDELVEDTIKEFSEDRDWSAKIKHNLTTSLRNEWEDIKDHFREVTDEDKETSRR